MSVRILVTGGGRGIGRAIALRFAREGAQVVVAARTSPELDSVVAEVEAAGGTALAAQVNVGDEGSVEAAVYRASEFCGGTLDVLVNCAGTFSIDHIEKLSSATWDRHIGVNLTGAFYVTSEALQYLEESDKPHIFNIASTAAKQGFPGNAAYCATKYGLRGFGDAIRNTPKPRDYDHSLRYDEYGDPIDGYDEYCAHSWDCAAERW